MADIANPGSALDESTPRRVKSVAVVVHSARGERRIFTFKNLKSALAFLESAREEELVDTTNAPALLQESRKKQK